MSSKQLGSLGGERKSSSDNEMVEPDEGEGDSVRGEAQNVAAAQGDENVEQENVERTQRKREMNVIHSRRKRERQKIEIEVLRARSLELSGSNLRLFHNNKRLEDLNKQAEDVVDRYLKDPPPSPPLEETKDDASVFSQSTRGNASATVRPSLPSPNPFHSVGAPPPALHAAATGLPQPATSGLTTDSLFSAGRLLQQLSSSLMSSLPASNMSARDALTLHGLLQREQQGAMARQNDFLMQQQQQQSSQVHMTMLQGAMGRFPQQLPVQSSMAALLQLQQQQQQQQTTPASISPALFQQHVAVAAAMGLFAAWFPSNPTDSAAGQRTGTTTTDVSTSDISIGDSPNRTNKKRKTT